MNDRAERGRYTKGGFGIDQNLILFLSLAAFILAYYFGSVNDGSAASRFDSLKNSSPVLSNEKIKELNHLSSLEDVEADFSGDYAYLVDYGSGKMLRGDIMIDQNTMSRSISINHLSMYGRANYKIVGSTVQYSDIEGDVFLFNELGTAIGDHPEHGKYLEIDGDMKLFVETQYTEDEYKPLSKALDLSIIEQIKLMSLWSALQILFGTIGVGILLYILINIIRDNRTGPKKDVLPA